MSCFACLGLLPDMGETLLPSITILTNGFNLPDIPLKLALTRLVFTWLGGVWESQVELRDVVGDAVAGALVLHLLGVELLVLVELVELVVELNFDLVTACRCGGRPRGWCSPSPPTWPIDSICLIFP